MVLIRMPYYESFFIKIRDHHDKNIKKIQQQNEAESLIEINFFFSVVSKYMKKETKKLKTEGPFT